MNVTMEGEFITQRCLSVPDKKRQEGMLYLHIFQFHLLVPLFHFHMCDYSSQ